MVHNCHQLLSGSQEALLKVLEEPPAHVHFIVCTTNPEALKDTFKRRCHIYEVELLNSITLMKHLKKILLAEKMIDYPIEILDKIVELSGGSAGIALKYLDMVVDMGKDKDEALSILKSAGACESEVIDICRALINFKVSEKSRWLRVRKLLSSFKTDGESARRPILGYLDSCLLTSDFDEGVAIALMMDEFRHNFFDNGKSGLDVACFKSCFLSGEE
jgi:DNA polymerase III delta prime subunit